MSHICGIRPGGRVALSRICGIRPAQLPRMSRICGIRPVSVNRIDIEGPKLSKVAFDKISGIFKGKSRRIDL